MNSNLENDNKINSSSEFQDNLATLRQIPFFSKLPIEKLKILTYLCTRTSYKKGDFLFKQDDDDGQAFYIIQGTTLLMHKYLDREISIREYGQGSFLGGIAVLGTSRRIYSLKALDDVVCLVLTRAKFIKILEQFPELILPAIQGKLESIHTWEKHFLAQHAKDCDQCCVHLGVSVL